MIMHVVLLVCKAVQAAGHLGGRIAGCYLSCLNEWLPSWLHFHI